MTKDERAKDAKRAVSRLVSAARVLDRHRVGLRVAIVPRETPLAPTMKRRVRAELLAYILAVLGGCGSVTPAGGVDAAAAGDAAAADVNSKIDVVSSDSPGAGGADGAAATDVLQAPAAAGDAAAEARPVFCMAGADGGAVCGSNCDVTPCAGGGARAFSCGRTAGGIECVACAGASPFCWSVYDKMTRVNQVSGCGLDECR